MSEDNKLFIRESIAGDIKELYLKLRKADIEEVVALGSNPITSLCEGYIFSEKCYTTIIRGEVAGMFGYGYFNNTASIWFLGSELTNTVPREWLILGRQYINQFLEKYPVLTNIVSTNNVEHIRWLKKLGAIFSAPFNFNENSFKQFYIIKGE